MVFALSGSAVGQDIRSTRHNLSSKVSQSGSTGLSKEEDRRLLAREVCVFCHTPSVELRADGSRSAGVAPQWQRSIERNFSFEIFDDIGRAGTDGAPTGAGSVSIACLSCHDSTQAWGVSKSMEDHPFGVPYRGLSDKFVLDAERKSLGGSDTGMPRRMGVFIGDDSEFRPVRSGVINNRTVWWASTMDTGQRTKSDLPLYPRKSLAEGGGLIPYVECTSCHDPHIVREVFLRVPNVQSGLCLTCHVK